MAITEIRSDPETGEGYCEVDKLGPVLDGRAGFTLSPTPTESSITWFEDVAANSKS